jgi:signal transduction histidine kinase/ligand-binding sensor domain-containing protein/CheY-like chemotaxis protein
VKIGTAFLCAAILAESASALTVGLDPRTAISQFHQDVWGSAEGLPAETVPTIVQTPDGYLWFGTELGLLRFDGLHFTTYDKSNTPAFKNTVVDALAIDSHHDLWIGTRGGGVLRLRNGEFAAAPIPGSSGTESVRCLLAARNGDIWIGTDGQGVIRLHAGRCTRYTAKNGLNNDEVFALAEDSQGSIWIGTRVGLSKFQSNSVLEPAGPEELRAAYVRSLYAGADGTLWIGTNSGGLVSVQNGQAHTYRVENGLSSNAISSLRRDSRGSMWIGTVGGGLCRLAGGGIQCYSAKDGLPAGDVWALYEDRDGDLWIGTATGGLARLSNGKVFKSYGVRQGLSKPVVLPVFEDHNGDVWIGTYGGGLNRLRDGKLVAFGTNEGLPDNMVFSVAEDKAGDLWIGTRKGLTRRHNGRFTTFTKKDGLPSDIIDVVYADSEDNLWIGTRMGLGKLKGKDFVTYTKQDGMSSNIVQAVYEDHAGDIWVGTAGGGLNRFRNGKFDVFDSRRGLTAHDIFAIYEDAERTLWVGTDGGGLFRFRNGRFSSITSKQGLADDQIFAILEDGANNLWMSGNKGVFRVNEQQLADLADRKISAVTAITYGRQDGMDTPECDGGFQPAGWKAHDGRLWFPTTKGAVVVDPRKAGVADTAPVPVLEEIIADGREMRHTQDIQVPPGRGSLEFRYSAPDFQAPQKTVFRYRLAGFDSNWVEAGTRRVAYYTNIPPGTYRLELIASNDGKTWSHVTSTATILLRAHFYQTAWFYLLCMVTIAGTVALFFLRHARQAQRRERALEDRVEVRTAQLRKEIAERERAELELIGARDRAEEASRTKSQFLANMSHEIRTPMNGIMGMIDLALTTDLTVAQYEYLSIVKNSADSLLTVINDILDLSKVEAGKLELDPVEFDFRECLEETARLMAFSAEQKRLKLICDLDPEIPATVTADPIRLRQIVLNLLGNSIKFTEQGEVVLKATVEKRSSGTAAVHVVVRDTGIGIAPEQQELIFEAFSQAENASNRRSAGTGLGLTISRRLIELMGGRIWVDSKVGQGSKFHFIVELAISDDAGTAAETVCLSNTRVLIVDDDTTTLRVLTNTLRRWGARTGACFNGAQALSAFQQAVSSNDPFSIVVADTAALSIAEFQQLQQSQGNRRQAQVVLMCRSADRLVQAGQYGNGSVTAYLPKPLKQRELRAALLRVQASSGTGSDVDQPATAVSQPANKLATVSRKILVAEDNAINQKVMLRLLQARGHKVLLADSGQDALNLLDRESVDMVFMDIQMPVMDGFQVTAAIREKERTTGDHLPVIATTACALKGDRERCLRAGMDGYIAKPVHPDELFATVENFQLARSTVA